MADLGATPLRLTPAEFQTFIAAYTGKWSAIIKGAGAKVE